MTFRTHTTISHSGTILPMANTITFKISKEISSVFVLVIEPNTVWNFDGLKYETKGYSVVIDKVEFYDDETRIYLTALNDGKATLYVDTDDSVIIQNKKQFNTESIDDVDYEELPYSIAKGASATGAISFSGVEISEFEYTIEIHSDNYDEEFEDVVFVVNSSSPFCKNNEKEEPQQETTTENNPPQNAGSNDNEYAAAVTVAKSWVNGDRSITPADIKSHMLAYGYSETTINHALYNGFIDWSENIRSYIWALKFETNICISACRHCNQSYYGDYQLCPIDEGHGTPNRWWIYGYSRAETVSRLIAVGFAQSDVDAVIAGYEYGEFVDEVELGDYIILG